MPSCRSRFGLVACVAFALTSLIGGCAKDEGGPHRTASGTEPNGPAPTVLFSEAIKTVSVEIDYAPGAEPFVGRIAKFGDVWGLFRSNTGAVFEAKKDLSFPTTLAQMERLDDVTAQSFTFDDLLAIAERHRDDLPEGDRATFYVLFVNGTFQGDDGLQPERASLALGNGVIVLFKPAIRATKSPQLVEQAALLHAFGHAIGFVGVGVPVNSDHLDSAHGDHCTNNQCIMHYRNESASALSNFVARFVLGDNSVLYGQECLSDIRLLETR